MHNSNQCGQRWKPIERVSDLSDEDFSEWVTSMNHVDEMLRSKETYSKFSQRMLALDVPVWAIKEGLLFARRCERGEYGSGQLDCGSPSISL